MSCLNSQKHAPLTAQHVDAAKRANDRRFPPAPSDPLAAHDGAAWKGHRTKSSERRLSGRESAQQHLGRRVIVERVDASSDDRQNVAGLRFCKPSAGYRALFILERA